MVYLYNPFQPSTGPSSCTNDINYKNVFSQFQNLIKHVCFQIPFRSFLPRRVVHSASPQDRVRDFPGFPDRHGRRLDRHQLAGHRVLEKSAGQTGPAQV